MDDSTRHRAERQHDPAGPACHRPGHWPPPRSVRRVLRRARGRYHRLRPPSRPALDCPASCVGLFRLPELLTLARAGAWPLPPEAPAWLRKPPDASARRRRRSEERIAGVVRHVLAEDLPEAVEVLLSLRRADG
jgi:hypothetical protein